LHSFFTPFQGLRTENTAHFLTQADECVKNRYAQAVAAAPLDVRKACGFPASGQPKCFSV